LDDLNPQIIAHFAEQALQQGALDVMLTPVIMKKGRPGTLLTVLCDPEKSSVLERLLLRETSTLGIRIHQQQRSCLDRSHHTVSTDYGEIRIKVGSLREKELNEELNATPEFEDCRAAAAAHNVPVKQVIQSAIAAYHSSRSK
ncbi:MAG TPA: nickel insertion protein, partial [Edaphobacter sp.]|uniref:nickel insertion protein n=1 Tax=Edaphobacter sp. TaxID=1934404 RepID=UPI002B9F9AFE